jgi:hypothetical protein
MPKYLEWDIDNPKHRQRRRRRPPPPIEGEVLEPEPTAVIHRVEIVHHHRRQGPAPQRIVVVVALCVLAFILLRSPGALIMLAVLIPGHFWIALGVVIAALVFRRTVLRD